MSQDVPNEPSPVDDNPFQPHRPQGASLRAADEPEVTWSAAKDA